MRRRLFMSRRPHSFFDQQVDRRLRKCVDLKSSGGAAADVAMGTAQTHMAWRTLRAHVPHTFHAFAWKAWRADKQHELWNRSHATWRYTLTPAPVLQRPCLMSDCDVRMPEGLAGHQCLPSGGTTLYSRDIARAIARVHSIR